MINSVFFTLLKKNLFIVVFCIIINYNSFVIAKIDFFSIALVPFLQNVKKRFYKKTIYRCLIISIYVSKCF